MGNDSKLSIYVKFDCTWKSRETVIIQTKVSNRHQIYFYPINFLDYCKKKNYVQRKLIFRPKIIIIKGKKETRFLNSFD